MAQSSGDCDSASNRRPREKAGVCLGELCLSACGGQRPREARVLEKYAAGRRSKSIKKLELHRIVHTVTVVLPEFVKLYE